MDETVRTTSPVNTSHDATTGEFVVTAGEVELARYTYRSDVAQRESPRPYLHPLRTPAGNLVSLYRPHDHVWHKGIAWSLPHLGHDNFWGGPTFVKDRSAGGGGGYVQLDNDGSMDTVAVGTAETGAGDVARFGHRLDWHTQAGAHVVTENRELSFRLAGDAWVLTFATAMTNVSGERIMIGSPTTAGRDNAGYGGLFWRGPRAFTGGDIVSADRVGDDSQRGTTGEWMAFSGKHDEIDASSTVLFVDDRENPRHPPQWFARSEQFAALCPAPFFSEELPFEAGATLTFRYAVVIADGASDSARGEELADLGRQALAATVPTFA